MTTEDLVVTKQLQLDWTAEDASSLYMIDRWGGGYFHAGPDGEMTVTPLQNKGIAVPIIDVVREAQVMNLATPLLIRFQDLLRHRVETLNHAFLKAIAEHNYRGDYRGDGGTDGHPPQRQSAAARELESRHQPAPRHYRDLGRGVRR